MKADVAFISCVKAKADRPMPAKDLYVSPWFHMARGYVERHAHRWFILSAAHCLVPPDFVIEPYDLTLKPVRGRGQKRMVKDGDPTDRPTPSRRHGSRAGGIELPTPSCDAIL